MPKTTIINERTYSIQQHATCKKWRTVHDETDVPEDWPKDNPHYPMRAFVGILYIVGGEWHARTDEGIELDPHHYQPDALKQLIKYYSIQRKGDHDRA